MNSISDVGGSEEEVGIERSDSMMKADKIRSSFTVPAKPIIAVGAGLALCAGMVNSAALLRFGAVVTHTTGHVTGLGLRLEGLRINMFTDDEEILEYKNSTLTSDSEELHSAKLTQSVLVLTSFIFGAFLCGLIIPKNAVNFGGKSFYGSALLVNSALLVVAAVVGNSSMDRYLLATSMCACASGLQNAMCTMHLGAVIRTTHVTGTSTDIGSTAGRAVMILCRNRCSRKNMPHVDAAELFVDVAKLGILLTLLVSFFLGTYAGCFFYEHIEVWTLIIPAGITGTMGLSYAFFRDTLKRQYKKWQKNKMQEVQEKIHRADQRMQDILAHHMQNISSSGSGSEDDDDEENDLEEAEVMEEIERAISHFEVLHRRQRGFSE
eukprot:TRINITY_DN57247_c0_g1_i1.p1 TRINITY_DN57247_c0_g1~~TRINITY_DN57247_c0_g1_i1.p1  ORF type:complete len:379 (+),score=76.76 TRINITY_DN57247_c0_g1_i1:196-1332(+)